MLGSSWLIPTTPSAPVPVWARTAPNGRLGRLLPTLGAVLLAVSLTGCESIETVDTNHPLPPKMTATGLALATKASWQSCLTDFYKDDWTRMNDHLGRMDELVARWKAEPPPVGHEKEFLAAVKAYEEGVAALRKAVESKNVDAITDAMRGLGRRVAAFETMR
jgi:hypothetical protein